MAKEEKTTKTQLIVERGDGELWGRITVKGNLVVDSAKTLETLKKKFKASAYEIEGVKIDDFEISYDLTSFFEQFSFLNISDIAKRTGINPGLMRQYASGVKFPSEDRVKDIEEAIRNIGKELSKIKLHKPQKETA